MIPESFIENWRTQVNWQTPAMVEQDLVISRALVCSCSNKILRNNLVFRRGMALDKKVKEKNFAKFSLLFPSSQRE